MQTLNLDTLIAAGYRRTSNKYGLVSRIDREDWVDVLIIHLLPWCDDPARIRDCDMERMECIKSQIGSGMWEDHYRRCCSKDKIELRQAAGKKIPTSQWDATGYIAKEPHDAAL